jgi:hypothetical protein
MDEIQAVITVVQNSTAVTALVENIKLALSVCKRNVCAGRCKKTEAVNNVNDEKH